MAMDEQNLDVNLRKSVLLRLERHRRFTIFSNEDFNSILMNEIEKNLSYNMVDPGTLKLQLKPCLMLLISFFLTMLCFPSLIVYKPLPFNAIKGVEYQDLDIAILGCINVGLFLIFRSIGMFVVKAYARPEKVTLTRTHNIVLILCQVLFVIYILFVTIDGIIAED